MINILLHDLNHSGTSHAAVVLANKLIEQQQVNLIIIGGEAPCPFAISPKINLVFLGVSRPKSLSEKLLYIPKSLRTLSKYISAYAPKNLLVFGKEFGCMALLIRQIMQLNLKIIVVNSTYITGQLHYTKNPLARIIHTEIYKELLPKADYLTAVCQAASDDMVKNYKIPANKISVVYPALAEKFFTKTDRPKREDKEILFIGRLDKYKAPEKLLNIFPEIAASIPDIKLRFVGDGELRTKLETTAKQLSNNIIFDGVQADVLPYINNADVLVMTSLFEGFGQVLAEAIACGTPVVSLNFMTGPNEIIQNGENGYLVTDEKDLSNKIIAALNQNWDRDEIRKTAAKFDPGKVLQEYVKIIDEVFV